MRKNIKFTTETQSEDREVISTCYINLPTLSLELSTTAKTMFELNRDLFDKINMEIKLLSGKVYRQEITNTNKSFNKNGVPLDNSYDFEETEIAQLSFLDNKLINIKRYKSDTNKIYDYNPNLKNDSSNNTLVDSSNLSEEDVSQMTMISEVTEIELFENIGIKTLVIKDNLASSSVLGSVSYRLELLCASSFDEYVKFVSKKLSDSINFLKEYYSNVNMQTNYDKKNRKFSNNFKKFIFESLDIRDDIVENLGKNKILNSNFGQAGIAFYNASKLVNDKITKDVYRKVLSALLPTNNNSPRSIQRIVESFQDLEADIVSKYAILKKDSDTSIFVSKKNPSSRMFIAQLSEMFSVENEKLGYNIFSENQTGVNSFTRSQYRGRINQERAKYFPSINTEGQNNFLTREEKAGFSDTSNQDSYVTPVNLVFGNKKISTSRGMSNMNVQAVKSFRLAKADRAEKSKFTNARNESTKKNSNYNMLSSFNLTIVPPRTSLLSRNGDTIIDPLIDAKEYMGENSFFVTSNPRFIQESIKKVLTSGDKKVLAIATNIINRSFLREKGAISTIKDLQFSNKKSKIRGVVSSGMVDVVRDLPPQIKYMCTQEFQTNPNIDPLKNSESRELIEETQKNIFVVKALTGFEKDKDGFYDLNLPIIKNLSDVSQSDYPIIAKAYNYEVPELGLIKDKFLATIYNNLLYIKE